MEVRKIEIKEKSVHGTDLLPTIIKWKDVNMVRSHSIKATVREIIHVIEESLDLVSINIIGNQSTGKTELAITLGHLIHKMSKLPFSVRLFGKDDLLKFADTLKSLKPTNYVLIFDDLSFLKANASTKQIELVKQAITEIRHLPGGKDVKIIIIKVSHYTLSVDKYLRQNDYSYFTTVGSSEMDNIEKIVTSRYMRTVRIFKTMYISAITRKKFIYKLGSKGFLSYNYKNPFIPILFWNNESLRLVVSPLRTWIDPICSTCEEFTNNEKFQSEVDIPKFIKESGDIWGESTFKTAVLIKLKEQGINALRPKLVQAMRFLDKILEKKKISLEGIAVYYGIEPTNTKLFKKIEPVLEESKLDIKLLNDTNEPNKGMV